MCSSVVASVSVQTRSGLMRDVIYRFIGGGGVPSAPLSSLCIYTRCTYAACVQDRSLTLNGEKGTIDHWFLCRAHRGLLTPSGGSNFREG